MKALLRAMISALFILSAVHTAGAQGTQIDNATCLGCHGAPRFAAAGADGQTRALFVAADRFAGSVHAALACTACHTTITEVPHKSAPANSRAVRGLSCKRTEGLSKLRSR